MKEVHLGKPVDTVVIMPGSKSISHRALLAAALAGGRSYLRNFLVCQDTEYTIHGLRKLGVGVSLEGDEVTVSGTGGEFPPAQGKKEIFLGNSGTSYRFLVSATALASGDFLLRGSPRMHERPIGHLLSALNQAGVEAWSTERKGYPPVQIRSRGIPGGEVSIRGEESSQYLSSLLLSAPYAQSDLNIEVKGKLVSRSYVDVTLDVMEGFGVSAKREGYRSFNIPSGQCYTPCVYPIEGDVSSASYFWAAAAVTGGSVITENIRPFSTRQGDIQFLDVLEEMGCRIEQGSNKVRVTGCPLSGIEVDMGHMPDMVPTLAAIALFAEGKTRIRNISHLRYKESDRLKAIVSEWSRLGGRVSNLEDGLLIHGGSRLAGTTVDPHEDHRLAMSLAVVGLKVPGIRITRDECVHKSFPTFWELWKAL